MATELLDGGQQPLVLIANDQEWTARAIESILVADGYQVLRTYTARETLDVARSACPDIVILDQQLPDFSGVEVCRQLRADPLFGATLPVLITTAGPSGRQQRLNAYEAGAWDFFGQPLDAESLIHKLTVYQAISREARQLRRVAMIDAATGLYSRSGLARRSTELLGEARRSGRQVAVVVWDLADPIDSHSADRAGALFRQHGRAADTFGRLETTRFAAIAPGTGTLGAERFAERMQERIAETIGGDRDQIRTRVLVLEETEPLPLDGETLLNRMEQGIAARDRTGDRRSPLRS